MVQLRKQVTACEAASKIVGHGNFSAKYSADGPKHFLVEAGQL